MQGKEILGMNQKIIVLGDGMVFSLIVDFDVKRSVHSQVLAGLVGNICIRIILILN